MPKVPEHETENNAETTEETVPALPTLDEVAREGARRMLAAALEQEVAQYVDALADARDENSLRLVVRNGRAQTRAVTCGAGTMQVQAPRVNDRRVDEDGGRQRFTSRILPPYMRRSPQVAEVLPVLYLCGLSTGDFREALPVLLGEDAAGLSPTNISRLTAAWEEDYREFRSRDLSESDCVYVWEDGIHCVRGAKRALREIMYAKTGANSEKAIDAFVSESGPRYHAASCRTTSHLFPPHYLRLFSAKRTSACFPVTWITTGSDDVPARKSRTASRDRRKGP